MVPFRKVFDGILYILRTGCQWKMGPDEYGPGSTCHRRFQEWGVDWIFSKGCGLGYSKFMIIKRVSSGRGSNRLIAYL